MSTSYTALLGLALPVTGELQGTWGDTVNNSITQLCEDSIAGVATQSVLAADWTLTTTGSGAANQARMAILIPTGAPGVSRNIIAPSKSKIYTVINQSNANVVIKGAATTGVTIAAGDKVTVVWNGSDFVNLITTNGPGAFTNLTYTGTLTGSTGIINIGSNQIYKDAAGNVGLGVVPSGTYKLQITGGLSVTSPIVSTVATGTAPFTVASTTQVANLNAATAGTATNVSGGTMSGTSLTATGVITLNTTTNSQQYTTTGAGTISITSGTTGNINNMNIGATTAGTGAFTTLSATSTVSGAGFSTYLASPPAIGSTTANTGAFTNLTYTGTLTGSTGIINIGTGQIYKDAAGNLGLGTTSPAVTVDVFSPTNTFGTIRIGDYRTASAGSTIPIVETLGCRGDANSTFFGRFGASKRMYTGTAIPSGHVIGAYAFGAQWGTDLVYNSANLLYAASITGVTESSFTSATTMSTAIVFNTGSVGTALTAANVTYGSEAMRISSAGNLGLGTSNPISKLMVSGVGQQTANLTDAGSRGNILKLSASGSIAGDGGAITFGNAQSDIANSLGFAAIKGLLINGGGNTLGDLAFSTRNATTDTALTERMRITFAGEVGIGTSSPGFKLDVVGDIRANPASGSAAYRYSRASVNKFVTYVDTADNYIFYSDAAVTERMRIASTGEVGIGTNAPTRLLTVQSAAQVVAVIKSTNVGGTRLRILDVNAVETDGLELATTTTDASIAVGTASVLKNMQFATGGTEQMRITSAGNLAIGATSAAVKLVVNSTDSILLPKGTTLQRPTGVSGYLRFNTDLGQFEGHNGTSWNNIGGLASNLAGGSAGTIPYQSATDTTAMLAAGTSGNVLISGGAAAPSWSATTGTGSVVKEASPALTGTPTAPTATSTDNSTTIATTAFVNSLALGVGQTWASFTSATRAVGTTYTNSTGKPILVIFCGPMNVSSGAATAVVNGLNIGTFGGGGAFVCHQSISFIVPAGATYSITGNIQYGTWSELR